MQIGAPEVEEAVAAYRLLLGVEPVRVDGDVSRFQLARGAIEIVPGEAGLQSIRFVGEPGGAWPDSFHGLRVLTSAAAPMAAAPDAGVAIDHVVVRTSDSDRAIALWRDRVGLRLALDRVFPERGMRLTFLRSAGITLELATSEPPQEERTEPDAFYGVSYRVSDLEQRRVRLLADGIDVSEVRRGMRPGTSVVSVRSGTGGVPTLLLQVNA